MKTGHASDGMPRFSWVYTATLSGCTRKAGDAGHDTGCAHPPHVSTTVVGAGLPANTVVAATVNGGWKL
ncbi:TPA: hypothetical protein ACNVV3_005533, partial [Pseudomonas putida]